MLIQLLHMEGTETAGAGEMEVRWVVRYDLREDAGPHPGPER